MWMFLMGLAQASTYYMSDVGVRGLSRGGAFVAGANDISAQWYNPSALTRLHGSHFQFETVGVKQFIEFDRLDYPGEGAPVDGQATDLINDPISNQAPLLPIPHFGYITDFGKENLTVMLGFTTPYATGMAYPEDGPQRYSLIDSVVIHTFTGPAIAYKATPWLSLGLGTSWNYMVVGQTRRIALQIDNTICDGSTENPQCDIIFEAYTADPAAFAYNLSTTIEPEHQKWAFAFMWQPQIKINATGTLSADFTETFFYEQGMVLSDVSTDEDVTLNSAMPTVLRTGFLVRPKPELEIELSAIYEGWSSMQSLDIQNVNMFIDMNDFLGDAELNEDISLPTNFKDSFSARLGWEWTMSDKFTARQGFLYKTSGLKNEYTNPGLVDRDKWGLGLGGSWSPNASWTLDAGFMASFMGTWDVVNSKSKQLAVQINPFDENSEPSVVDGRAVSDGTYSSTNMLGGLSATYHFGQK